MNDQGTATVIETILREILSETEEKYSYDKTAMQLDPENDYWSLFLNLQWSCYLLQQQQREAQMYCVVLLGYCTYPQCHNLNK